MPQTRNTGVLNEIITALGKNMISPLGALAALEEHFEDKLLVVASDTQTIDQQAQQLRLAITTEEARQVLDYLQKQNLTGVPIETVDEVINALFPGRFQEP